MKIDLLHNKIVKDTMTERFRESVEANLVPLVLGVYPEADGILMYEDYIADSFVSEGRWFYPLTVKNGSASSILWVTWRFGGVGADFASRSPYSYVGEELLEFETAELVPEEFEAALDGRASDYDESAMKINVRAASDDPLILAGRYSQTFVDELARQMTGEISRAMALDGLGSSTIELELVFAPGTYMEHTSENVTYRRLLLVDGASKPRDFWVKWMRVGGGAAFTVSDHVLDQDVLFELGEDVAHKIREKEYRFLCASNPNTYQAAMGKKSVTEWRDLIKRAIRRGEIVRLESELVLAERAAEVHDKMADMLASLGYNAAPETPVSEPAGESDAGFDSLMDMVRAALEKSESHVGGDADEQQTEEEPEADAEELSLPGLDLTDGEPAADDAAADAEDEPFANEEGAEPEADEDTETVEDEPAVPEAPIVDEAPIDDEEPEALTIDELLRRVEEAELEDREAETVEAEEENEEPVAASREPSEPLAESDEPTVETPDVIVEADDDDEPELAEDELSEEDAEPMADEDIEAAKDEPTAEDEDEAETVAPTPELYDEETLRLREESIRREIEAKVRLEYEALARAKAEAELERLLAESRALREENERLAKAARDARELHQQALSDQLDAAERARATEDQLRRELEAKERQEARERDRLAEAARLAVEEQRRREAEEREAREREEAELREREEAERREAERLAEEERYLREAEEAARREAEEKEAAERAAAEAAAKAAAEEFISKRARIIFRTATDPNVISRIREIIEDTIRRENKQHVRIHMKAYQEERDTIILDILKMPRAEHDLLVAMVKAIGNARIGVVKIILE